VWPLVVVASAFVNPTLPKFVRVTVRQRPYPSHADGASAIHSAEVTSGEGMESVFVNDVLRVRFLIVSVTFVPPTMTDAQSLLPGVTLSLTGTDAAGTSSYHTEYEALPYASQSVSVPICSSVFEAELPPRPTQNAEDVVPFEQVAFGCVQPPLTVENVAPLTL